MKCVFGTEQLVNLCARSYNFNRSCVLYSYKRFGHNSVYIMFNYFSDFKPIETVQIRIQPIL